MVSLNLSGRAQVMSASSTMSANGLIMMEDVAAPQQALNVKSVWKALDEWMSFAYSSGAQDICQRLDHSIANIRQSFLLYWQAAAILPFMHQRHQHETGGALHFFDQIHLVPFLQPDNGLIRSMSSYIIDNNNNEKGSSWLLGGLSSTAQLSTTFVGNQAAIGGLVTVSIEATKLRECLRSDGAAAGDTTTTVNTAKKNAMIESEDVLIVVSALPSEYSHLSASTFHRITMVLKRRNNTRGRHDDAAAMNGETVPQGGGMNSDNNENLVDFRLSKCVWFDEALSQWSPSGCATLIDPRRRGGNTSSSSAANADAENTSNDHNDNHEENADDAGTQFVICECTHITEFAVMMYSGFEDDANDTASSMITELDPRFRISS